MPGLRPHVLCPDQAVAAKMAAVPTCKVCARISYDLAKLVPRRKLPLPHARSALAFPMPCQAFAAKKARDESEIERQQEGDSGREKQRKREWDNKAQRRR